MGVHFHLAKCTLLLKKPLPGVKRRGVAGCPRRRGCAENAARRAPGLRRGRRGGSG